MTRVIVVGAGVVGLSAAVRLLEAGHRVDVLARDLPLETTSSVAAALWYPYLAYPRDRVTAWSSRTYEVLAGLADEAAATGIAEEADSTAGDGPERDPAAASPDTGPGPAEDPGVRMVPGTQVLPATAGDPWWRDAVPGLERVSMPGYADAWSFVSPVVEMPRYLAWLHDRVERLGGTVSRMSLACLPAPEDGVVVNCSGLGSRLLGKDHAVRPVRGQVVLVEQIGLDRWWLDADGPTYVVPRSRDIVVGGTEQHDDWSRTPDPGTTEEILERAYALVPRLRQARVLATRVGLRPARPEVRVERAGDVVHCYGHGGAGVTLSWGCAEEVVDLVG